MEHAVLVVDDDPSMRQFLKTLLEMEGYAVSTAANGAEGIERLLESRPCVILLDVEMPVMDGRDFRDVQKHIAPDVPIVCITGATDPARLARHVGAARCHPKPTDTTALCGSMAELCNRPHHHCGEFDRVVQTRRDN